MEKEKPKSTIPVQPVHCLDVPTQRCLCDRLDLGRASLTIERLLGELGLRGIVLVYEQVNLNSASTSAEDVSQPGSAGSLSGERPAPAKTMSLNSGLGILCS